LVGGQGHQRNDDEHRDQHDAAARGGCTREAINETRTHDASPHGEEPLLLFCGVMPLPVIGQTTCRYFLVGPSGSALSRTSSVMAMATGGPTGVTLSAPRFRLSH